jgi:hypothetical protein
LKVSDPKTIDDAEGAEAEAAEGLAWERALYHVGWYTGVDHVQYCSLLSPHFNLEAHTLPAVPTHCRQDHAVQGSLMRPQNLPVLDVEAHFLSCMDGRAEYAVFGAPGGDLGEFIRGIQAVEKLLYRFIDFDEIDYVLKRFLKEMTGMGKHYFFACGDASAQAEWFAAAGIEGDVLIPLDAAGRRELLRTAAVPEHLGETHYKNMLEDETAYEVRTNITKGALESFHGIRTNWFDPMRSRLLYVPLDGERAEEAVLKVVQPETCAGRAPLVVPRLHTVLPTPAGEIRGHDGDAEGGGARRRLLMEDEDAGRGNGVGSSALVYHFIAANRFRIKLAKFLASLYDGLDPVDIAAKMNWLGTNAFEKEVEKYADGKPQYTVTFWP